MMMVSSTSTMDLSTILQTLESKKANIEDRVEAYTTLSSQLKEDLSFASLDLTKQADRVLTVLKKDIQSSTSGIQQGALEVLGFCLHDADIVGSLSAANSLQLLTLLRQCVETTDDKTTATRALWCLSKHKFNDIATKELPSVLDMCEQTFTKWKGQSTAVEHETLSVVSRLVESLPNEMKTNCVRWGKHTVPLLVHPAVKIREKALALVERTLTWLAACQDLRHKLVAEYKSKICAEMKKLFVKNEIHIMKSWRYSVYILAEELHHGSFINNILPIAELGFKHASPDVKIEAFRAWKYLIDNFALSPAIVSDPKRVKLVMQVFKINNAKVESVALEKLKIWWHFIKVLGAKIHNNFDQVIVPLLHFCAGGVKPGPVTATPTTPHMGMKNALSSPATPRLNLTVSSPGLSRPAFPSVQVQGLEVIARILACPSKMSGLPQVNIALDSLSCEVIAGTAMFLKHASAIIASALDLICAQGGHVQESLLLYVWQCLLYHLSSTIESSSKSENREAFSTFLGHFQTVVFSRSLAAKTIMKLFQPVCSLPQRALSSTAYSVHSGEVIRGTPALFLCEVLLAPSLLQDLASSETYISLFSTLVNCGTSTHTGVLEFCQAVLDVISRHAEFVSNPETLWRLWSIVANTLQEQILKSNEVNQGDSLEYNFDCMYAALMLPVRHKLGSQLAQPVCKSMMKTWAELYRSFARLSALVTNAEPNVACEELCHKVMQDLGDAEIKDATTLDFHGQISQVVIDNVDFSSLGQNTAFAHGVSLSPSKWIKRKHKPMENLQSFIKFLVKLLQDLAHLAESGESGVLSKQKPGSITSGATCLIDVLSTLFTHVTVSTLISKIFTQLAEPVAWFFAASARKTCNKLFSSAFMQKLDKLWLDISTCIQSRYTLPYDTDFLQSVSPLLRDTLLHPRRQIKNQSLIMWKATFSHSAPLSYPEDLRPILMKVKEKTPILLPGWIQTDSAVIEETPFSQFSQMDSQGPDGRLPGMPSPHKIIGSFMHKAMSPNIKKSPAKASAIDVPATSTAKKKLSVNELRDEDFVIIKTSPKKKRVLTEHQKEVMKERRSMPAMYNNLELSQDVSLMSQFSSDTQQESILVPSQSQNDSIIVINSSQSQNQDQPQKVINDDKPSVRKSSSCESLSEAGADGKRNLRRRSVRFSSSDEKNDSQEKNEKTEMKSPPVPRATRSRKEKDDKSEKKDTDGDTNETKKVSPSIPASVKPLNSSGETQASPSLKQNLMEEMRDQWLNTFSSKSTTSSVDSKSGSDKEPKTSQESMQESQEEPGKFFSPFKSFSQSPPERKPRSPGRKSRSQELPSSSKSPKRNRDQSGQPGLDKWLVKSPAKSKTPDSQKSPDDSFVPNTQFSPKEVDLSLLHHMVEDTMSPVKAKSNKSSQSFVEDTQSPSKFSKKKVFSPDVNASIEETPTKETERKTEDLSGVPPSRNLFSEDKDTQDPNLASPDSLTGTPVLKISKLSPNEVVELSNTSPAKSATKSLFKEPAAIQKDIVPDEDSEIPCSQGFNSLSVNSRPKLESQMSGGFSEMFDTQKSSSQESENPFTGILSAEQREELNQGSTSSSNYSTSVIPSEGVSSQESDINVGNHTMNLENENMTEDLFASQPAPSASPEYQPDPVATLKEGSSQGSTKSSQGSVNTRSSSQSLSQSQESQESLTASDAVYNPDDASTLSDDHGRKRKQEAPKKIGADDVRRTPRQRKRKTFDGFEVDHPSATKDGKAETPRRRSQIARKLVTDDSKDESKKETETKVEESTPARKSRSQTAKEQETEDKKIETTGKEMESVEESTTARRSGRTPSAKKKLEDEKKEDDKAGSEEDSNRRRGRSKKMDEDNPLSQTASSQEASSQSTQDKDNDAKRKARKRKLEKEESDDDDDDDVPLSQISETKSKRQGRSQDEDKQEDEDEPKRKTARKSLTAEMSDSQESNDLSEPPIKKPKRVQLQAVDKSNSETENLTEFQKKALNSIKSKEQEGKPSTDKESDTVVKPSSQGQNVADDGSQMEVKETEGDSQAKEPESQTGLPDSAPFSEVIVVDMEFESKSSSEQTQEESQIIESDMVTKGEHTPTNKPSSAPVRRSTTKQKIEAARKRSISKMSNKSADDSSVEDAAEWKTEKSKEKEGKTAEITDEARVVNADSPKENKVIANLNVSFCKDSPFGGEQEKINGKVNEIISSLASPVLTSKMANRKRKRNLPKITGKGSPLSVRLRSSRLVLRARAHLGSKTISKASPLSLVSAKRKHLQKQKLCKDSEKDSDVVVESNEVMDCDSVATKVEKSELISETMETQKDLVDMVETSTTDNVAPVKNVLASSANESSAEKLDETPRKPEDIVKNRLPHANRGFSDSKVLSLNKMRSKNRMADRGMSIVRRSILKQRQVPEASSPSRKSHDPDFHPIRVFQFHSPSASPSAGILKKRRLIRGNIPTKSPSPPSKRRVSFAEPIISGESPHRTGVDLHQRPRSLASKQFLFPRRPAGGTFSPVPTKNRKSMEVPIVDSQPSQSPASYKSTQESQLNCTDPVYPDLIACTESVTKVLPQLTSSVWSRGLGQLVKARNIHTVGDLSKLTEVDIHNLPIRSPKVVTVRRVLSDLEQHLEIRRSRDVKSSESDSDSEKSDSGTFKVPGVSAPPPLDTIRESCETDNKENRDDHDEPDSLPSMDDALSQLSHRKDGVDLNSSIEIEPVDTKDQSQISTQPDQSGASLQSDMEVSQHEKVEEDSVLAGERLVKTLDSLMKETDFKGLQKMRTGDLFQVHQNLTQLSNLVITAMKSRCHSPPNSH